MAALNNSVRCSVFWVSRVETSTVSTLLKNNNEEAPVALNGAICCMRRLRALSKYFAASPVAACTALLKGILITVPCVCFVFSSWCHMVSKCILSVVLSYPVQTLQMARTDLEILLVALTAHRSTPLQLIYLPFPRPNIAAQSNSH